MTGGNPEKPKRKVVVEYKFTGVNPEGKPHFRKVERKVGNPEDPNNVPSIDELPPVDPKSGQPAVLQDHFMNIADRAEENDKKG